MERDKQRLLQTVEETSLVKGVYRVKIMSLLLPEFQDSQWPAAFLQRPYLRISDYLDIGFRVCVYKTQGKGL